MNYLVQTIILYTNALRRIDLLLCFYNKSIFGSNRVENTSKHEFNLKFQQQ